MLVDSYYILSLHNLLFLELYLLRIIYLHDHSNEYILRILSLYEPTTAQKCKIRQGACLLSYCCLTEFKFSNEAQKHFIAGREVQALNFLKHFFEITVDPKVPPGGPTFWQNTQQQKNTKLNFSQVAIFRKCVLQKRL